MKRRLLILSLLVITTFGLLTNQAGSAKVRTNEAEKVTLSISPDEGLERAKSLVALINKYRREQGLSEIPYSPWLTYVARWHVYDLENKNPASGACNTHSWSNKGEGRWTNCCDIDDDDRGCSWDKPKEISNGAYNGVGFEIACKYADEMSNSVALDCWKKSSPHLDMMLNRGTWADNKWKAIGAGISYHYAVVWFAEEIDNSK